MARREGLRRGWLTYGELIQMLPPFTLAKFLLNNITIIAVSYAASVITIAGALFLAAHVPGTSLHRQRTQLKTNTTDILNGAELDNNSAAINETSQSVSSASVITLQHNRTNLAFNVEDELLKLEQQYREEALRDSILQRQNEISTESRLTLPQQMLMAKINVKQKCAKHGQQYQQQGQWFAHKEEYSDYEQLIRGPTADLDLAKQCQNVMLQTRPYGLIDSVCTDYVQTSINNPQSYDNSTMVTMLWHFLTDTVQHTSFMRLPFVWLKFM